jgi:hypothetical protein
MRVMAGWAIAILVGGIAAMAMLTLRRRRAADSGARNRRAAPPDPLYREATQYFASGALPRWDP